MQNILISRVDAIGDVVLTLPLCGWIKKHLPQCKIIFLCASYTLPVVECCQHVDEIINYTELKTKPINDQIEILKQKNITDCLHVLPNKEIAFLIKKSNIKNRIGTSHRWYHWFTCNGLVTFSRKKSSLHEAQLNIKLAQGLGIPFQCELNSISNYYGFQNKFHVPEKYVAQQQTSKTKVLLHPKSHGSGREWSIENYQQLIAILPPSQYEIYIAGTEKEKPFCTSLLTERVHDMFGKFSLQEYIAFINTMDVFVACSTGPLHIAAALGKKAIGLYPPIRPLFPTRWKPLGKNVFHLSINNFSCTNCKTKQTSCMCINQISATQVVEKILL